MAKVYAPRRLSSVGTAHHGRAESRAGDSHSGAILQNEAHLVYRCQTRDQGGAVLNTPIGHPLFGGLFFIENAEGGFLIKNQRAGGDAMGQEDIGADR